MRLRLHHTAVILCVTTFGLLAHGRQLVEFHAANIGATFHPQQTAETDTLSEEPIPGGDGQVTRALFRWGPTCQNIEFHVRNLTENILPADVTRFTLHLNLPPEHGCKELLLRLRDRKGEIFQCSSRPFAPNEQGPVSREFVLNAATTHSFGKNIDKVIDRPLRLSSLYIRCQDNGRGGALQFDRLLYRVDGEGLFVDFAGDSPMNLLYSLDAPARFRVENAGSVDSQFSGEITLRDSFGGSVTTPLAFPLKAGETTLLTIPDDGQRRFGICYVDYVLRSAQGYELRSDFPFVRMTPAGKAANRSFVFGLGGSSGPYGRTAFTALGINGIRVNSGWYHVQPRRDVWDWSGHDRMVAYREEHGIESLYIVTSPAAWGADKNVKPINPKGSNEFLRPDFDAYRLFLGRLAERYRGRIRYYIIGNEPDLTHFWNYPTEEYLAMLKVAHETIHAADPTATVLNGGISSIYSSAPRSNNTLRHHPQLLAQMTQERNYDMFNFHGHGHTASYLTQLKELASMGVIDPERPWLSGETGISLLAAADLLNLPANDANKPAIQLKHAAVLHEKVTVARAYGAKGFSWWNLITLERYPEYHREDFGLLDSTARPRAAFPAYANVIRNLQTCDPDRIFAEDSLFVYGFRAHNGDYVLSLWTNDRQRPDQPLWFHGLNGAADHAEHSDLFGNRTPLPIHNGAALVVATNTPAFLRFSQQTSTPDMTPFITWEDQSLVSGQTGVFTLKTNNPFATALPLRVHADLPGHLTGAHAQQLSIAAASSSDLQIDLIADQSFLSLAHAPEQAMLHLSTTIFPEIALRLPVVSSICIPAGPLSDKATFRLDRQDQITSYAISGPENHLFWQGPNDLAADVFLTADNGALLLKIVVCDDQHTQPYNGANIWKGDSVQFAIILPGQRPGWEFGLSLHNDGQAESVCFRAPGIADKTAANATLQTHISRDDIAKQTTYAVTIPYATIGMTDAIAKDGVRFNVLVNDHDGEKRKNCIRLAPGLESTKNISLYPVIRFR